MKKRYTPFFLLFSCSLLSGLSGFAQCAPGYTAAQLNWDYLDYFVTSGNYAGFVTAAQAGTQRFAMGPNGVTVAASATNFTLGGENTTHGGDLANFTGSDVQYLPNVSGDSVVITFDTEVLNFSFALYDVDNLANYTITARNAAGAAVGLNIALQPGSILTVGGTATSRTLSANNTALLNNSNSGAAIVTPVSTTAPIKTVKIVITARGGDPVFWLSDFNACVSGSFPNNWRNISRPFTGMPAYIITVVDNQFLLLDPATGFAKPFFQDPGNGSMNGVAYDPVNRVVYYVYNRSGAGGTINQNNRTIRRYRVDPELIDTAVANVVTDLNIPTFNYGVESAAASFYGGVYYFGVEGHNSGRNSGRENSIWRIEFGPTLNAVRASQVYSVRCDSTWGGNAQIKHDWSDVAVSNNGILYDFDGASADSMYYHFNLMTGQRTDFAPSGPGTTTPKQTGVDWAENIFNAGNSGGLSGSGFVVPYNMNGTVASAQQKQVYTLPGPTYPVGSWSDCGEAFRPLCDFGDAPASYDPDPWSPAVHEKDTAIRLGATWDREWLKLTPMDATGDGSDEDGILFVPPYFQSNGNYIVQASVYNNTGENATLLAWFDYNGNGTFDAGEACQPVPPIASMPSMQNVYLTWTSVSTPLLPGAFTYLRVRLVKSSTVMTAANATGYYNNGETEDYRVFIETTPLPVKLHSFTATAARNGSVILNWRSEADAGLEAYVVERSGNQRRWTPLAQLPPQATAGVHNYQYTDGDRLQGRLYYRLRLVGKDATTYSEVREVRGAQGFDAVINGRGRNSTVFLSAPRSGVVRWSLLDMTGRMLQQGSEAVQAGSSTLSLNLRPLVAGTYLVRLAFNEEAVCRKLVVE